MSVAGSLEQLRAFHFGASLNSLDQCGLTLRHTHYQRTNQKTKQGHILTGSTSLCLLVR